MNHSTDGTFVKNVSTEVQEPKPSTVCTRLCVISAHNQILPVMRLARP